MALPEQLKFVEYKPSDNAIPVEAINAAYDRLDRISEQTEIGTNKILQTMAAEMNNASAGDKAYLQDMYNQINSQLESAVESGNLPGYSRSIKNMVGSMLRDPMYQAVRQNADSVKKAMDAYREMSMKYGQQNVVMAGDDPTTFSTQGPDGQPQLFMGMPQQRPDYNNAMQDLYMKNVDIVKSVGAVDEFVDDMKAFEMYKNTPAGRIHLDEISRELSRAEGGQPLPFIRATAEVQNEAIRVANEQLRTVGHTFVKGKSTNIFESKQFEDLEGMGIISSGVAGNTITDGTEAADQVMVTFDDQVDKTLLDNQLLAMFRNDRDFNIVVPGGTQGPRRGRKQIDPNTISNVALTSNVSSNGLPLIAVTSNSYGQADGDQLDLVEMPLEDIAQLGEAMTGFVAQLQNSTQANRRAGLPLMTNIFATDLSQRLRQPNDFTMIVPAAGAKVVRTGNRYQVLQLNADGDGIGAEVFNSEKEVRNFIGAMIMNRKMGL